MRIYYICNTIHIYDTLMEMFIFLSECRAEYATEYRAGSRVSVHSFILLDENVLILSRIQLMDKLIFNVSFYIN